MDHLVRLNGKGRLRIARELLRQSDFSITDIAAASALGSSSNFSKLFHRRVGRTPLEYRKHHQKK